MESKSTAVFEMDIYDINDINVEEKLKPHLVQVYKFLKLYEIKNAKVITRVKELSFKQWLIHTEIEEELTKIHLNKSKDE